MSVTERVITFFDYLKKNGIDQKDFSKSTGIKEGNISSLRIGRTKTPKADMITAILKYDERVNPYWLLALAEEPMFLDGIEKKEEEVAKLAGKIEVGDENVGLSQAQFDELKGELKEIWTVIGELKKEKK